MPKRFSATEKWQDEWFSSLKPLEKLVFLFMIDTCDNAGFFEVNPRLNAFIIGITQTEYMEAINGLERGYYKSVDGKKIWIRTFLLHQKNWPLNETNNAHKQILFIIESNRENFKEHITNFSPLLAPNLGLISPIGKGIGKGIGNSIKEDFENLKIWNTKPSSEIELPLPEQYIKSAIEQVKITKNILLNEEKVKGMYGIFKTQNLTGVKYYQDASAVFSHFLNWLKTQNFKTFNSAFNQQEPEQLTTAEALAKQKSISSKYN